MIKWNHLVRFEKCVEALNALIAEIREYEPDAGYHMAVDALCLLSAREDPSTVESSATLKFSDCGDIGVS